MKISKLLNKKIYFFYFIFLLTNPAFADDKPVDIWNIDQQNNDENLSSTEIIINNDSKKKTNDEFEIYNMQSQKKNNSILKFNVVK